MALRSIFWQNRRLPLLALIPVGPLGILETISGFAAFISLKTGEIWGWEHDDGGDPISVDRTIDAVQVDEYDALVIPGGQINPDLLRAGEDAVIFVKDFFDSGKPVAAVCHAPWVLIEAGLARGPQDDSSILRHKKWLISVLPNPLKSGYFHWCVSQELANSYLLARVSQEGK